jgi:hypothetical protein
MLLIQDWHCEYKDRTGILQRESTWTNAADMPPVELLCEAWASWVSSGGDVLFQHVAASLCEQHWSAHGHIHSKVCNKLLLETTVTKKLVYVYSNIGRKLVSKMEDTD